MTTRYFPSFEHRNFRSADAAVSHSPLIYTSNLPYKKKHMQPPENTSSVWIWSMRLTNSWNIEKSAWKTPACYQSQWYTLQGTNISHLVKRKIIFKIPIFGDMLVPWRVSYLFCLNAFLSLYMGTSKKMDCTYFGSTFLAGGIFINISRTCQVTQPMTNDTTQTLCCPAVDRTCLEVLKKNHRWKTDGFHKCGENIVQPPMKKTIIS